MKILWISYAPWTAYSYSGLSRQIVPRLVEAGHEVIIGAMGGFVGMPIKYQLKGQPVTVCGWRSSEESFGELAVKPMLKYFKPDQVVLCADIWRLPPDIIKLHPHFMAWGPVHHDPPSQAVRQSFEAARIRAVYSKWGARALSAQGISQVQYMPCPVDKAVFQIKERREARRQFGLSDEYYIVGLVGINHPTDSKGFIPAFHALAEFCRKRPEVKILFHSELHNGIDLRPLIEQLDLIDRLVVPDIVHAALGLFGDDHMVNLYNACDVLLNASKWEGFGLPIVEAQLCGTPAISPAHGAAREVNRCEFYLDGRLVWLPFAASYGFEVNTDSIIENLTKVYETKFDRQTIRDRVLEYGTETVFERYWLDLIKRN